MRKRRGFTLLELVIVIAIIAILIGVAVPKFAKSNLSAQAAAHNSNVRIIKNAALLYIADNPDAKSVSTEDLTEYIEGKIPKPAKKLEGYDSFKVDISDGVKVTPGNVKVEGKKLVLTNDDNS